MIFEIYQPCEIYQIMGRIDALRVSKVDVEIRVRAVTEIQTQSFKSIGMRTFPADNISYQVAHPFMLYWNQHTDGLA